MGCLHQIPPSTLKELCVRESRKMSRAIGYEIHQGDGVLQTQQTDPHRNSQSRWQNGQSLQRFTSDGFPVPRRELDISPHP